VVVGKRLGQRCVERACAKVFSMSGCLQERDNIGFAHRQREKTVI
jgi:hypothetical protein